MAESAVLVIDMLNAYDHADADALAESVATDEAAGPR